MFDALCLEFDQPANFQNKRGRFDRYPDNQFAGGFYARLRSFAGRRKRWGPGGYEHPLSSLLLSLAFLCLGKVLFPVESLIWNQFKSNRIRSKKLQLLACICASSVRMTQSVESSASEKIPETALIHHFKKVLSLKWM